MKTRLRLATLVAIASLAAFAPPRQPDAVQQQPPKSWIPEQKPDKDPPITALVDPPQETSPVSPPEGGRQDQRSRYQSAPEITCVPTPGSSQSEKAKREFVETYQRATAAMQSKRYNDALTFAEQAAAHAGSARQRAAIEQMRIAAFAALSDDINLVDAIRSLFALNCMSPQQAIDFQEMLDAARERLAPSSKP